MIDMAYLLSQANKWATPRLNSCNWQSKVSTYELPLKGADAGTLQLQSRIDTE